MEHICGVTFAPFCGRGVLSSGEAKISLLSLKENTGANTVLLAPGGLMENAHTESISYAEGKLVSDDELKEMIDYAHSLGLMVFLKPTVNCKSGDWRAYISFFEEDVPCEPKWHNWFASYAAFQAHYASIAQSSGCEMFIAGCEMVMTEHRADEWRGVISEIRRHYSGPISYNTDKYQEHNVSWWDAVDYISSSGYYPSGSWDNELSRIEKVVRKFDKPFFFAETGCMSTQGSPLRPNDWSVRGDIDPDAQKDWYEEMFKSISVCSFIKGTVLWSWSTPLSSAPALDRGYDIYGKPACEVVKRYYKPELIH